MLLTRAVLPWLVISCGLGSSEFGISASLTSSPNDVKPHIILIVADDLGWNDVSWNNPHAITPNLEELAKEGVLLSQSYVQPLCTPTRSALLTGRYPFALGRQRSVLFPEEPTGLSIKRQLLPEALKAVGYSTHAVGKWHLGFCSWDYTPTSRGFDTFWGFYCGKQDYYLHIRSVVMLANKNYDSEENYTEETYYNDPPLSYGFDFRNNTPLSYGFDFRNNTAAEYSVIGTYSSYLYSSYVEQLLQTRNQSDPMFLYMPFQSVHTPLQVPQNYTEPFVHIKDEDRKTKLGMVLALDEAVGRVIDALKTSGHYNNSVIVFTTDNGGPTIDSGNNWPLRGNKTTLWEGGTRGVAFVHSPLLPQKGIVSNKLIHVTDWFSTLTGLGGGVAPVDTDGYDQWEAITSSAPSPRKEMIYNIDITNQTNAGVRLGDYKLLIGDPGPGIWTPPPEGNSDSLSPTGNLNTAADDLNRNRDRPAVTVGDLCINLDKFVNLGQLLSNGTVLRLYNLVEDPEERNDQAEEKPDLVETLLGVLQRHMKDYVEPDLFPSDPNSDPAFWNNIWTPGWCQAK